jgi:hypothetical protein
MFSLGTQRVESSKHTVLFTFFALIKGPFGRAFPSASPLASTEALPNP